MYAQVIVDVAHTQVAHPFTYIVPGEMTVTIGQRVKVPLGHRNVCGIVTAVGAAVPQDVPLEKLKPIMETLEDYPALLPSLLEVAQELALECHCPLSETLRLMLPAAMRTQRIQQKKEWWARLCPGVDAEAEAMKQTRSQKRAMLLRLLQSGEPKPVAELSSLVNTPMEPLKALQAAGLITLYEEEVYRPPDGVEDIPPTLPPPLTDEQQSALDVMLPALDGGRRVFLLNGVTGSGKTEVYLAMVEKALAKGLGAIILVPEIALTPQMVRWFHSRFGNQTAVLHSRLTDGQRYDEWRRIRLGKARVVVGARSAVFAPVEKLGLIVVDEEHEQTYLSDKHPRYDAREMARRRAEKENAVVILSSATPSILSFARARRGDYTLVEMPSRILGRPMPKVTVVDMRKELDAGNRSIFSYLLMERLKECLGAGQQAMLFINHRGYNTFVTCRKCGYVVKCEQCDLSMTLHNEGREDRLLHCHMCGSTREPPTVCPECGSKYIRYFGSGTQRVEDEVRKLFPDVRTVRMDMDTTKERNAHAKLLNAFGSGEAQVLIGTQMIAKGLDFPKVTLVGVIAADMTLNLPDYRSQERTFQLITQVAGRAGRAQSPGEVIVQTYKPESPCIQAAAAQDYRSFFEMEFHRRRTGLYPPFTMLARLLVECENEDTARAVTEQLYTAVQNYLLEHPAQKRKTLMVRADAAPVKRIRGLWRYHVLLKVFSQPESTPLLAFLQELTAGADDEKHIYCEINPVTMM